MTAAISRLILRAWGWKILGRYPDELPKAIIVVIPHTSNWDFPLGILVRATLRTKIVFLAKSSLFRPPYGWFFRWLGGYPVDRSQRNQFVRTIVDIYRREPVFHTVIAPEGTRRKVDRLKTGFYYIAHDAGAAMVLCRFDWGRKEVVFREPFFATGDIEADFRIIHDFFRGATGKRPALGYQPSA